MLAMKLIASSEVRPLCLGWMPDAHESALRRTSQPTAVTVQPSSSTVQPRRGQHSLRLSPSGANQAVTFEPVPEQAARERAGERSRDPKIRRARAAPRPQPVTLTATS